MSWDCHRIRQFGGSAPATLGFNAVGPEWLGKYGAADAALPFRLLSRRSGRIPALPYPPLRCYQSGQPQPRRATIFQRTAITPLTSCLTPGVHFTAGRRKFFFLFVGHERGFFFLFFKLEFDKLD
jgi:hypothetical protein